MTTYDDDSTLGITVYLHSCAFQVEIVRKSIPEAVHQIDEMWKEFSHNNEALIQAVMENARAMSHYVGQQDDNDDLDDDLDDDLGEDDSNETELPDQETLISEIAYSFLYAHIKKHGIECISDIRGFVGTLIGDRVVVEPTPDEADYLRTIESTRETASALLGFGFTYDRDNDLAPSRTLH